MLSICGMLLYRLIGRKKQEWNAQVYCQQITTETYQKRNVDVSRVVVLEPTNAVVEDVIRTFKVKHGNVEFDNHDFNGIFVKHAHILTST